MSHDAPQSSAVKSLVIVILLLVVAVQGWFLWRGGEPASQAPAAPEAAKPEAAKPEAPKPDTPKAEAPKSDPAAPGDAVEVAVFRQNTNRPGEVIVSFTRPVGEAESSGPLVQAPFRIEPDVPGVWHWAGPYILRFTSQDKKGVDPARTYTFTAVPEAILPKGGKLGGRTQFTVRPAPLAVHRFSAEPDPVPGKPGVYVVRGSVSFSRQMQPREMEKALRLVDPRLGPDKPVPLHILLDQEGTSPVVRFESDPVQADDKTRMFTLLVDKDATRSDEGFVLDQTQAYAFPVVHASALKPRDPGAWEEYRKGFRLNFSAKVDPDALREQARFEPPLEGVSFSRDEEGLWVSGNFRYGVRYALVLPPGFAAVDGAKLEREARVPLAVPDQKPTARFANPGVFLPKSGAGKVALETVNLKAAKLRVERVFRNNIFFALNYYGEQAFDDDGGYGDVLPYLGDAVAEEDFKFPAPRNQAVSTPVDLTRLVKGTEPGLYRLTVAQEDGESSPAQRWMLVTDLGVAAKRGRDDLLVWVSSFKDVSSVAGARVKVISNRNQVLVQGVTDAKGVWRAKGLAALPEGTEPYMISVEKDADYAFLLFDRFGTDMTGLDVSGVEVAQAGYQAFTWGERDIYRPGETVRGVTAVRDPKLKTPPPMPLKLVWSDPQGREAAVETLRTDAQGLASFARAMPSHAPTGAWTLDVLAGEEPIGQYRFQVEDFQPDRIAVTVLPQVERAGPGQELAFGVRADYLFGAPAAGLPGEASVVLTAAPFTPKGFEAYAFGTSERAFENVNLLRQEIQTDAEGKAALSAAIPQGLKPPAALMAVVTARVSEHAGRGVGSRVKIPVDAYQAYPGLKRPAEQGLAPGTPHAFEYVVVDPQGKEAQPKALVAELYEDRWQTVLRRAEEGTGYKYETKRDSRLVERRRLENPGAKGEVTFTPPKYGSYRLSLTDPDTGAACQITFWAAGDGYNPWAMENPARLELVPAKTDHAVGETARLQVRAPFPGRLLVTVESTEVLDHYVVDLPENTGEVSIPIKAGYAPNVYVTGMLARKGADVLPGQAGRAFGAVSLGVAREAGRMEVSLEAPARMEPHKPLTVTAKADPGAMVTLAVVDEGILQLVAQKTPDPWAVFYARRALEVRSFDTFALLLPEVKALARKAPAGGDDASRFLRTESPQGERSVAFWSGPLKADARGIVRFTVDVPAFQGALRVMAVAAGGARFGSAQHFVRVRSPLALLPTFPRFAQLGESMRLPVTVRNDTGQDGEFQVSLQATGALRSVDQPRREAIAAGKDKTVFFGVKASDAEGLASLAFLAEGGGFKAEARTELLVRSPLPAVSRIRQGVTEGSATEFPAAEDQGFLVGTVQRTLRVGRFPLVRFAGKLESLLGYPYGCLEQTVSRAFPLVYLSALARELEPRALEKGSPEAMVQQGVSRALAMQLPSGGFGMWPGAEKEQPWAGVWATHFLVEASRAGHQVPEKALSLALGNLGSQVKRRHQGGQLKTQAYALYVLALAGKPDRGVMDSLAAKPKDGPALPADAKALLAAAYAATGNAKAAEGQLAGLGAPEAAPPADDLFDSPLRAQALTLAALTDVNPSSQATAQAARDLTRGLEARPALSTQEAGMAFMALGKLYARQAALPACQGELKASGTGVARIDTARTSLLRDLPAGPLTLALPGCAPGSAFYSLDDRGIPATASHKALAAGLELKREFLDRDGKPLDMARLPSGTLVAVKVSVRSTSGPLRHVAVSQLLPPGLDVQNPRIDTADRLPWMEKIAPVGYSDYRADRVNVFLDLEGGEWADTYTLCRAVIPGSYTLPPVRAEAMYFPEIAAQTELGALTVEGGR
ncbi:putative lipoprotein YfhM [Fundidesulfovibrio magnetotacticus]|uniref:Putative lipoprotein YfhM n=1 Tax=Fundidesulfovibrio magnetotacticus TaxID=2730080 RepID=A0A6V8LRD1_9BACT|nr:MG2 domain-containing protein [Fundidesulfovibrio magnetotacticus]GFK92898.1 putative lipoprotein YfhM [Fundidesulfovibrio magnetotacticus]